MESETLRIGEVATLSNVSIDTVRYYERRMLLPLAVRSEGGFRLFTTEIVERVKFIKQAQELGFTLDEICNLLTKGGARECKQVSGMLRTKLIEIDQRMQKMRSFSRTLSRHLSACEKELKNRGNKAQCPVLSNILHPHK